MKIFIKGLNSCAMRKQKLNQYENYFLANGHDLNKNINDADYILVWTCAFRADVRDNSMNEISRYANTFNGKIILAGCLPDIEPEAIKHLSVDYVIPWRRDGFLDTIFSSIKPIESFNRPYAEKALCVDAAKYRSEFAGRDVTFQDQFIKLIVSEGCNFECSYCSERLTFPPHRSFPIDELVSACAKMIESCDRKEVILLADSLGNYGEDIGSSLPELIRALSGIDHGIKFALHNLNPASFIRFWDDMVGFIDQGLLLHLNLPIQSGSDKILKLMRRSYTTKEIEQIFKYLNQIGFSEFDTHAIAGFSGETESDFDKTMNLILRYHPKYVLCSTFMESNGMPAAAFPNKISCKSKKRRLSKFKSQMKEAGIIANTDDSDVSAERFRRLNQLEVAY